VLVHCEHGEDRTGLAIAAWRVRACKWTKEAAMAEALKYGYRRWLNYGLNKTWAAFQ
jgi:protein tyrosine/serine phosphatase